MAQVTDPIMLDSTGQDIKDQISALNTKIQTLNTLLADLGLVSITPISQEDYDALSQAEKLAGVFDIYDAAEPDIDGNKVSYDSNTSVVEKIDEALGNATTLLSQQQMSLTETSYLLYAPVNIFRFVVFTISWSGGMPSNVLFTLNGAIKNSRIYLNGNPTAEYADIIEFTDSTHIKLKATNTNIYLNIYGVK